MTEIRESSTPTGERLWEAPRGTLRCRRPVPEVVVFVETGFLHAELAPVLMAALDASLMPGKTIEIFVDAAELEGYAPEIRTGATEWLKTHRAQVRKQHMLVASRITKMGLSVASLALGGLLQGTRVG